jgi:hypothetical protein
MTHDLFPPPECHIYSRREVDAAERGEGCPVVIRNRRLVAYGHSELCCGPRSRALASTVSAGNSHMKINGAGIMMIWNATLGSGVSTA